VNRRQVLLTLCITGFAANISFSILIPVLPYYADGMGASPSELGFILAGYSYVTAIAMIPFGMLSDRVGYHRMLVAGLAIYTLAPLFYPLASNLTQLGLVRAFHGLACAIFFPATVALLLKAASPERWGEAVGWLTTATQSALVVGPLIGGLLLSYFGFNIVFYSCSVIPLLGLVFVLARLSFIRQEGTKEIISGSHRDWLKEPRLFAGLTAPFFFTVGSGTLLIFMPLFGRGLGIEEAGVGIIIAAIYVGSTLLRVPGGKLSDRIGRKPVMLLGLTIGGVAMLLISAVHLFPQLIAAAAFYGVGMGIAMSASYALVADMTPPQARGLAMGMTTAFLHAGLALGPTVMGVVAGVTDYTTMFRTCTLSLILGLIVVVSLYRSQRH